MESFTYVKRGYDPEEVDRYISTLEQVIKSYKEKDNAIKNAIISAQVAADNMVKNAKAQADEYKGQIAKELDKVSLEIDRQRMKIQAFQDVYRGLIVKYLKDIDENEISDLYARLNDVDKFVERLKEVDIVPAPTPAPLPPSGGSPAPSGYGAPAPSGYGTPAPPPPPPTSPPPQKAPAPGANAPIQTHAPPPTPPPKPPAPQISLGPSSSPSLNKNPMMNQPNKQYTPPQVMARINEDGNFVPNK